MSTERLVARLEAVRTLAVMLALALACAVGGYSLHWHRSTVLANQAAILRALAIHRVDTLGNHVGILRSIGADPKAIAHAERRLQRAQAEAGEWEAELTAAAE